MIKENFLYLIMAKKVKPYVIEGDKEPLMVKELLVPYGSAYEHDQAVAYQALFENEVALLTSSKKGLDAKAALDFLNLSGFSHQQFQDTFKTTVKTIHNYVAQSQKLDASLSEKILKAFALFEKGITVFGSAAAFYKWLNVPAYGLGNQTPFDIMDTFTGMNLIEEELIRLEYGDLA